jgi:hypothetical protein
MADYDLLAEPLTAGSFETGSGDIGDIFILNRALERVGIVSEYNSLVWTSRLWDHSEATMKCSAETALPTGAAFLQRSDSDEVMRIRRIHYRTDEKGTYLEVGCKGATTFFKDRVNWWTKSWENENLATAAYELAEDAQATYQGIDRTISGMAALADLTGGTHLVTKQTSWGDVAEAIYQLVRGARFGFGVRYVSGLMQPFVRAGRDLSASVVFALEYQDVASADFDFDRSSSANLAVVGGQGEGALRVVTTAELTDGEELAELWVDANDLSLEDGMTEAAYLAILQQRGIEKLADLPVTLSAEGRVTDDRYTYGEDYELGDTVTFRAFGIEVQDIVSEAVETIEGGEHRVEIALGTVAPTIRKLLR